MTAPDKGAALRPFNLRPGIESALERFVALLLTWQATHNLIAPKTVPELWTRHVADSLQLLPLAPEGAKRWIDLGSGGGFPGMVVAIAAEGTELQVTLVEANRKKAAFLRQAARLCAPSATIRAERIEALGSASPYDIVSARALAPLPELFTLAAPLLAPDGIVLAMKGKEYVHEEAAAAHIWSFDQIWYESAVGGGGGVAAISNLKLRKA
ncbi:16S rRNA (guanine(527)-N(7))-methyltransferase RsmG [Afifella pfennigii]|uniref:16S rRNA (guanine(527)-N(7))-methyltransferase RsmG n=1 Tax=Afifella pfennigii TaxID=209897 RepID=UPI000558185F|nr:16S rRNA (guanine(527)-N(7))-methyltransferase RsmG [Afifella pfennigii]